MHKKNKLKATVAIAVALAFIMPGAATFANNKKIDIQTTVLVDDSMSVATITSPKATSAETLNNESLTYSFSFIKPSFKDIEMDNSDYTTIQMSGCMAIGKHAGDPMLPVKSVKLLIPAMKTVRSVNVVGNSVELTGVEKPVFPYQNPVPIGSEPEVFEIDTDVYASDLLYPSALHDGYHVGYSHGYAILDMTLNPVQYIPGEGRLLHYPKLTVNIDLEDTGEVNQFFRNDPEDKSWVEKLVYNPEITESYTSNLPTFDYPGGLCDPSDDYDYVIITTTQNGLDYWDTSSSVPYNWDSLMDKHEQDDGLKCTLVTIQDITACTDYHSSDPMFNDTAAHIREFCKDAYEDWNISYVFVGGDDEWIPARHMKYEYESNVDSDIYWSNLDNTFNADHDTYWGEEGDLGFDLYSELFIGRITCDTPQDVSNWMTKSFYYADATDDDYLENAAFYGGDTTWSCQGDDFIDYSAIKGTDNWLGPSPGAHGPYPSWLGFNYGFETWNMVNPGNEYNLSVKWTGEPPNPGWQGGSPPVAIEGLKNAINNDQVTLISGIAHANAEHSLDVGMNSWEANYHNTRPFFIHDYGCHCGDMDAADDGVLHSMLFHSDTELAFACVYNTGYGWGSLQDTNSSSALQQKLFWDYMFDLENNSGSTMNWQLGKAMAYSKDTMAPTVNWTYSSAPGSWRGIIQGCLLFGDPAQRIKPTYKTDTAVFISPPAQTVEKGETFTASVYVEPTDWVIGVNFVNITFDPIYLQANFVTEGDFFASVGGAMMFSGGTINNTAGTISDGYSIVLKENAVNTSGSVFVINFTAKDNLGTSALTMSGVEVKNNTGQNVPVTVESGSVTVVGLVHDVGTVEITEPSANSSETAWIHFDDGTNVNAIGLTAGGTFEFGIRITPTELVGYDAWLLTTVKWHHGMAGHPQPSHSGTIKIYDAGTSSSPGALLTSEAFTTAASSDWEETTLSNPAPIDASKDIWVSIRITHAQGEHPAGVGPGPMVRGKGGWITTDGVTWEQIADFGLDYNWNIWAGIGNQPYADFTWTPPNPKPGETITFNASASYDPYGTIDLYDDFDGDSLFLQLPHDPDESWSMATSDAGAGYIMYENFWDVTEPIGDIHWWGLALKYISGWQAGNPNNLVFDIKFYADDPNDPNLPPDELVASYEDIMPPVITGTGQYYSGFEMYYFDGVDLEPFVDLSEGWVSIYSKSSGEGEDWLMWASAKTGDGFSYQKDGNNPRYFDQAMSLTGVGNQPLFPGTYPVKAVVKNYGNFYESFNVNAKIYKVTTKFDILFYEDNFTVTNLPPDSEEVSTFNDVTFGNDDGGMYRIEVTTELVGDENTSNDQKASIIEIISDSTPPEITNIQAIPSEQAVGDYVNISVQVTDSIEVDEVYLQIEYPDSSVENLSITQNRTGDTYYCNKTYHQLGMYTYHVWANDTSGNANTSSIFTFDIWDITPPEITDVSAIPDSASQGGNINITCVVDDNVEVDMVNVSISGPVGFDPVNTTMDEGSYYYNRSYEIAGTYEYFIWANDTSGNANISATYIFVVEDTTLPEISNVTLTASDPLDTEPGFGWENFSCTVTDNNAVDVVKLVLTGDTTTEYPMTKNGDDYYCNITISTADEYTYHIWANDTSDNENTSTPQPFNLSMNEDVDMNGQTYFEDLIAIVMMYGDTGPGGWVREDVDNNGWVYFSDLIAVVMEYGEWWK